MIEDEIDGSCDIVNKIDQIFVKGGRVAKVWKYGAVRKNYSDHDALFATIMI